MPPRWEPGTNCMQPLSTSTSSSASHTRAGVVAEVQLPERLVLVPRRLVAGRGGLSIMCVHVSSSVRVDVEQAGRRCAPRCGGRASRAARGSPARAGSPGRDRRAEPLGGGAIGREASKYRPDEPIPVRRVEDLGEALAEPLDLVVGREALDVGEALLVELGDLLLGEDDLEVGGRQRGHGHLPAGVGGGEQGLDLGGVRAATARRRGG